MTTDTKPTFTERMRAASTRDGRLVPINELVNKFMIWAILAFAAVTTVIFVVIMTFPWGPLIVGSFILGSWYVKRYGAHLPPEIAEMIERRRAEAPARKERVAVAASARPRRARRADR